MPPKKAKPQKVDLGALLAEPAKSVPKAAAPAPKAAAAKIGGYPAAPKARPKAPAVVKPKAAEKKLDLDAQIEALQAEAEAAAAPVEDAECSNQAEEKASKEVAREAAKVRRAEEKAAKEAAKERAKIAVEVAVSGTGEVTHVAEQADELVVKVQPSEFRKPGYVMIKGNPCKISDIVQMKLSTNGGNRKLHILGVDVFTGKKYDDITNLTAGFHGIDIPVTKKAMYTVIDVDESSGFLSLLTTEGDTKDDACLCKDEAGDWDAISAEVVREFKGGKDLQVTVLTIMGKDIVIDLAIG